MKVYITGHKGFVGSELVKRGFLPLICDVTNPLEIEKAIKYSKPDLVVHLASKSNIDWCQNEGNQNEVINVNVKGTRLLFRALTDARIPGVLISSDHIWRGGLFENHTENAKHTERNLPVNFYGLSRMSAEAVSRLFNMNIIRTSYLFNAERLQEQLLNMEVRNPVHYPVFIRRSFMHLGDFCDHLEKYCTNFYKTPMPKTLHLSGSERVSWFTFMQETAKQYRWKGVVKPRFREVESGAPRPWFGGLSTKLAQSLGFAPLSYVDGIKRMRGPSEH